jgi:hypothetical protein
MLALVTYFGLAARRRPSSLLVQVGLVGFVLSDVLFWLGRIHGQWLSESQARRHRSRQLP